MKIKKVDDKPMVIHTKKKAKIHIHKSQKASIKGSKIYTVNRSPKIKRAIVDSTSGKLRNVADKFRREKEKKTYRKSTVHQADAVREQGISKSHKNVKESNQSVKVKKTNLHLAGAAGAKVASDQMEGGKEVQQATMYAYGATRPIIGTASKGAELFRKQAIEAKKRKIKKVQAGKKIAKKSAKKVAGDTAKETAKTTAKVATKTATKVATTTVGSVGGPAGVAVGFAAGEVAGAAIERKDMQMTNRNRKIKFFLDKMKADHDQQDSFAKLVKDLVLTKVMTWIKIAAPMIGLVLLLLVLVVAIVAIPVMAVFAIIYNSPFAIFLPPLEAGDTVMTVTSAYVAEFNRDVNTLANDHTGYDEGRIIYVDYEGMNSIPSNYCDILAVYMVKYGVGDTATIMNDKSKGWLKNVVNDMCSYNTSTGSETITNEDGSTTTKTYLYVNVTLKSYRDMISVYGFGSDEVEMLEQFMSAEFLAMLGYSSGGGDPGVCELSETEINAILAGISNTTAKTVCSFVLHRVGYPYSQDFRDSGNYYDCSSLAYYGWRSAGVNIGFGGATTAAAEAQGLDEAGKTVSYEEMQPGDLIFYSFTSNGRYKNISHVAIYVGNGKVVEALNEQYGVIYRDVASIGKIVLIGRPN